MAALERKADIGPRTEKLTSINGEFRVQSRHPSDIFSGLGKAAGTGRKQTPEGVKDRT